MPEQSWQSEKYNMLPEKKQKLERRLLIILPKQIVGLLDSMQKMSSFLIKEQQMIPALTTFRFRLVYRRVGGNPNVGISTPTGICFPRNVSEPVLMIKEISEH